VEKQQNITRRKTDMPATTRRQSVHSGGGGGQPSPRSNPSSVVREMTPSPRFKGVASGFNAPSFFLVSRELELVVCCLGVFVSFSYFAVMQEDVYEAQGERGERFSMTFFALVFERAVNALCALLAIFVFGGSGYKLPLKEIFHSGSSQMLAMAASNEALRYVSYPTQVLGKSCKMVPVMLGGLFLGGRKFSRFQYLSVAFVTFGVFLFNYGKASSSGKASVKENSTYGLSLIFLSLVFDAITGGLQDKVKTSTKVLNPSHRKTAKPSAHESMLYTNLSGAIVALVFAVFTGQVTSGFAFCAKYPKVLKAIVSYSLASAVGQNFIYHTITSFDVLVLTTVTTTRKIFSTVYSVFRNPNQTLTSLQWTGCFIVFAFLGMETAEKVHKSRQAASAKGRAKLV
jgi:UDP-galactose transporter B1